MMDVEGIHLRFHTLNFNVTSISGQDCVHCNDEFTAIRGHPHHTPHARTICASQCRFSFPAFAMCSAQDTGGRRWPWDHLRLLLSVLAVVRASAYRAEVLYNRPCRVGGASES